MKIERYTVEQVLDQFGFFVGESNNFFGDPDDENMILFDGPLHSVVGYESEIDQLWFAKEYSSYFKIFESVIDHKSDFGISKIHSFISVCYDLGVLNED